MRYKVKLFLPLVLLSLCISCGRNAEYLKPLAKIYHAKWAGVGGADRTTVVVDGEGFDANTDKAVSFYETSRDDGKTWSTVKTVDDCNGSFYKGQPTHSAASKTVFIHIKGVDGLWSDRKLIE